MGRAARAATIAFLALACSERRRPPPPPPPPPKAEARKPQPKAKPAAKPPAPDEAQGENRRAELSQRRAALVGRIAELQRAKEEIEARHAQERAGLPPVDTGMRRRFLQYVHDARAAEHKVQRMQQRVRELEKVAKSSLTGRLKQLVDKREAIERRRTDIENAWLASLEETHHGRVKQSPFQKDLDLVRAVKRQWFAVSVPMRRADLNPSERSRISASFRRWLEEVPARKRIVTQVLGQPLGPKGKTPGDYDFTDLDFYILLELHEDTLDRRNIVAENRALKEARTELRQNRKEFGAVVQEINEAMAHGGEELAEYLDLLGRLPVARENATYLHGRIVEWERIFLAIGEIEDRHARESEEATAAVTAARRELNLVETELRRLGYG